MKTIEPIPTLALDDLLSIAASAIEDLLEHTDPNTSYYSGVWADVPGKLRVAMLQAGNSPVIPDTWIPVSEQLPEEGGRYWCYVEEQNSLGKSHYQWNCSWNGEIWGGAMMYGRVTHWMPLPAAPQEVK
ncbi:DUF551 domain-containing protein [Klebsiella michiganensis]